MDNATPVLIEDEAQTTPVPFLTMVDLVFGDEDAPVCQVCADRGTTHIPEDEL